VLEACLTNDHHGEGDHQSDRLLGALLTTPAAALHCLAYFRDTLLVVGVSPPERGGDTPTHTQLIDF